MKCKCLYGPYGRCSLSKACEHSQSMWYFILHITIECTTYYTENNTYFSYP